MKPVRRQLVLWCLLEPGVYCQSQTIVVFLAENRLEYYGRSGFHRTLSRKGWADFVFAFHDNEEIGPRKLARIVRHTGLTKPLEVSKKRRDLVIDLRYITYFLRFYGGE